MLKFFRKYQKIFFIIITVVIIATFVFFGTYQAFAPANQIEDPVKFETVEHREIRQQHFEKMCRLLGSETSHPLEGSFFNDGIVLRDILQSGAADLVDQWARGSSEVWQEQLAKEKGFEPYVHPQGSYLSLESVWQLFGADLDKLLVALKGAQTAEEAFRCRCELYVQQRRVPAAWAAYVLRAKEREYKLPADPRLHPARIALFGYKNIQDWFGKEFIEGCAKLIFNGATLANRLGYQISDMEVSAFLREHVKQMSSLNAQTVSEEFLQQQLRELGLSEADLAVLFKDILLFRRWLTSLNTTVLPDTWTLKEFNHFSHDQIEVEQYTIPEAYRLSNEMVAKRFECYLACVSQGWGEKGLPQTVDEIKQIEASAPELVRGAHIWQLSMLDSEELASTLSLRQLWQWQEAEENWGKLQQQFEVFKGVESSERITALNSYADRARIDRFTATTLIEAHPEWIEEALKKKSPQEQRLLFDKQGRGIVLKGILDPNRLLVDLEKSGELHNYTQDNRHYYTLCPKRCEGSELVTFEIALKERLLDDLLKQPRFQSLPPFEVTQERFRDLMRQTREGKVCNGPWAPLKKGILVERAKRGAISYEEAQKLSEGGCSELKEEYNHPTFYKVIAKKPSTPSLGPSLLKLQHELACPVRRDAFVKLIDEIKSCDVRAR